MAVPKGPLKHNPRRDKPPEPTPEQFEAWRNGPTGDGKPPKEKPKP